MHNMHVQRFQDSNERTDKNPCLGLRRVSVKQGVGERPSFFKECCFRVRARVDTNPNPNPNPKTAFSKKRTDPDPAQRCTNTRLLRELWKRPSPIPMAIFFFLPKSALFCDKISDVMIFGRPLFQWIEGEVDLIEMRYLHAVWRSAPFLLFLDFHFILEVVVPQDDNRNCWRMLKTTEHHHSSSTRIKVALTTDSRPKPPSLSYPAFQCISVRGV